MFNLRSMTALSFVGLGLVTAAPSFAQGSDRPSNDEATAKANGTRSEVDVSTRVDRLQGQLDRAQARIQQQQAQLEQLQKSLEDMKRVLGQTAKPADQSLPEASRQLVARGVSMPRGDGETEVAGAAPATSNGSLGKEAAGQTNPEESASIRYKGVTLTPGGFLEGTVLFRTRNENADISNTYTGVPLNGSSNSKLSEFRGSARDSRLSLLIQGNAGNARLTGYYETDFLGAAPTANFVQASSFTPRIRQAWAQIDLPSGWTVTGGQFWSLITTNRRGIATRSEYLPSTADGSYVVGFNWVRERAVRVTRSFHDTMWAALEIDDPENTYSAAFVPPNVMGLNTSQNASTGVLLLPFLANYSNGNSTTVAPDLVAKVAFEPGWGHFEIKGLGRFFRDRIASTAGAVGHTNNTFGYGIGFGAVLPVVHDKLDVIAEGLAGQGIGRYGAAALPDVTLNPSTGSMLPLREVQVMGGLEWHRNPKLDFYFYGGNEYAGRYAAVTSTGGAAGYGSPLVSYASCTSEVALNTCSGANRDVSEATLGYWYRMYKGSFGTMQYGNQVVYIHRTLWNGIGSTPQGGDLVVYSTMRFYLP